MFKELIAGRPAGAFGVLALSALLGGCAGVALQARPEEIPALEQAVARNPRDTDAATRLGVAYFMADRFEDAKRLLQGAVSAGSTEGAAFLYLGLANEELANYPEARQAYDRYLKEGSSSSIKGEIRGRLAIVTRKELQQQAKLAIQQESVLSQQPPTPNTIAVLPFQLNGLSADMAPLQTALADMIITDLGFTSLQSLERVRVQSMVDEMVLGQAGFTAPETGARMGRLLKSAHVVQGAVTGNGNAITVDATVANTGTTTARTLNQQGQLDAIFTVEKQVVFAILDALGVQVTAREREAITNNRTGNLVAFLAYGRGLDALDRGDYAQALSQFQQATRLDPGFSAARAQQVETQQITDAGTTDQIGQVGIVEVEAPQTGGLAQEIANEVNFSPATATVQATTQTAAAGQNRNPQTEQQTEPPITQAKKPVVTIVIPRPAGSQ
jgi:tetratricopeptide (TPR) repeat protein